MEPTLHTEPKLLNVLNELMTLEPIFHHPELGTTRAEFEGMVDADFWEVGASGKRYSREYVLDVLEKRAADQSEENWGTKDFYCREISPVTYLLTYTLIQPERTTRRATLWRRTKEGWKILYHQGTVVEE